MKKTIAVAGYVLFTFPKRRCHATPWRGTHEASGEEKTVDKSVHCLSVFEKKLVQYAK